MKHKSIFGSPIIFLLLFTACSNGKVKVEDYNEVVKQKQELEKELENQKLAQEQARKEREAQQQAIESLKEEQEQTRELDNKAIDTPVEPSGYNLSFANVTYNNSELSSGQLFEYSKIRYIQVKGSFVNNVGRAGRYLRGKLYFEYITPDGYDKGSEGFYDDNGEYCTAVSSRKVESNSDIVYFTSSGYGSSSGGTYSVGKHTVKVWFLLEGKSKAVCIGSGAFEVY